MLRTLIAALATFAALLPALPASAATEYTIVHVPTVDGATLRVEIVRDPANDPQPVILTYSPYNSMADGFALGGGIAEDSLAARFVPQGYARAYADVLGTRGSTGCWDYGGLDEQQSGVDVVNYLAEQDWSNGNVAMIGVSYEGTTASMVAAAGDRAPGLKAIVPVAAISRWYGYAYSNGVRYFLNSFSPSDEGFDTPLAFDFGFGRTVPVDPDRDPEGFAAALAARTGECDSVEHTQQAYSPSPDYGQFWLDRDYIHDVDNYRASMLIVHGWQDYNVKQEEAINLYDAVPVDDPETEAIEGVPHKLLWLTQSTHADGSGAGYPQLLEAFFAETLQGVDGAIDDWRDEFELDGAAVRTQGRDFDGAAEVTYDQQWPPASTQDVTLHLGRWFDYDLGSPVQSGLVGSDGETGVLAVEPQDTGIWTWVDTGTASELVVENDPLNEPGHGYYSLFYSSPELATDVRVAGRALLDAWVRPQVAGGAHLTPVLLDVAPDGTMQVAERGFLNLDYRNGLEQAQPLGNGQWGHAVVDMLPQDYTFRAGHRIGLLVMSSNDIWALPGTPAGTVNIANGPVADADDVTGARLVLPVVDAPDDAATLFTEPAPTPPSARAFVRVTPRTFGALGASDVHAALFRMRHG